MPLEPVVIGNATLYCGDSLEILSAVGAVDAVVTDPPYGLSFMGKRWDYDVPSVDIWRLCLAALKPGGHLLSFAGTRTQHRMAVNIEDAGFEIRDMIAWIYGSGFPKSHNVSKAIDKARKEDLEPTRRVCRFVRAAMDRKGLKSRHLVEHFDDCHPRLVDHWAARDTDSQPTLPTWEQWLVIKDVLSLDGDMDSEVWRLNGRKGQPGDAWQSAEVVGTHDGVLPGLPGKRFNARDNLVRAATDAAKQWAGWGTALKPSLEPITVARKPLIGTVAQNVLEHGTGALNIDASRVVAPRGDYSTGRKPSEYADKTPVAGMNASRFRGSVTDAWKQGRWPANLIHDGSDEVEAEFAKYGETTSGAMKRQVGRYDGDGVTGFLRGDSGPHNQRSDSGTASRFFYSSKVSKSERNQAGINNHPTVKPVELMRYLCRLVTPPGGVVLDPFMGSGSTGIACAKLGLRFVGIERDEQYFDIACKRIADAYKQGEMLMEMVV